MHFDDKIFKNLKSRKVLCFLQIKASQKLVRIDRNRSKAIQM